MSKPIEITDSNYEEIISSGKPVIIDFWAEWCGPCRIIAPVVEEMANDYDGKVVVGKVDVDNNPSITAKFGVRSIPTAVGARACRLPASGESSTVACRDPAPRTGYRMD